MPYIDPITIPVMARTIIISIRVKASWLRFTLLECPACPVKYVRQKDRPDLKHLFNGVKKHRDGVENISAFSHGV
jgi:hypothetical protein